MLKCPSNPRRSDLAEQGSRKKRLDKELLLSEKHIRVGLHGQHVVMHVPPFLSLSFPLLPLLNLSSSLLHNPSLKIQAPLTEPTPLVDHSPHLTSPHHGYGPHNGHGLVHDSYLDGRHELQHLFFHGWNGGNGYGRNEHGHGHGIVQSLGTYQISIRITQHLPLVSSSSSSS